MKTGSFVSFLLLLGTLAVPAGAAPQEKPPDDPWDPFQSRKPAEAGRVSGAPRRTGFGPSLPAGLGRASKGLGGRLETTIGGESFVLPVLAMDVHVDIAGDVATVTVVQTFDNPSDQPLNATYVFPLNEEAAVFEMVMMVGEEVVRAEIRKIEEARREFEGAKRTGKSAALLCEHRPNLFTQEVANLMPELPVTVTLRYVQTVPRLDDAYELVVPLVVGPRYEPEIEDQSLSPAAPAVRQIASIDDELDEDGWELDALPEQPPVYGLDVPEADDPLRVSFSAYLDGGMPIVSVESPTHPITVTEAGPNERHIALTEERMVDNRDFVLRYQLAGNAVEAGVLAFHDERGGFFSVLVEPPATVEESAVTPREMVFVLDCSGSMNGLPLDASKAFMRQALRKLRATDSFRIIRFSDGATEFSARPLAATPDAVLQALRYVDDLAGEGGTVMTTGIEQALAFPPPPGAMRIVVFLTDGYIGNEHEVLALIKSRMGDARLFAFGVGTAVNRFLLTQMGRIGRGFTRYMDPTEDPSVVASELAERLQSPVLTNLEIDWGDLAPQEVFPDPIPDLFAGHTMRVQGRFERPGKHDIVLQGKQNGRPARLRMQLALDDEKHGEAVALTWARSAIADAMEQLTFPADQRRDQATDADVARRVTDLGLDFSLVTRWTAFVAVSERVVNLIPESNVDAAVPVPMVEGLTPQAYPRAVAAATAPVYGGAYQPAQSRSYGSSGAASPEPATMTGLAVAAGAAVASLLRRRRHAA